MAFFKIGLLMFGGGYSMLPVLTREVVDRHGWVSEQELLDYFAIGQCTPGIIAVNTATLIGYKQRKTPGALCCTLGVISPSIIIITIVAATLQNFAGLPAVRHAFAGIRVAVCALIASAVIKLFRSNVLGGAPQNEQGVAALIKACWLPLLLAVAAFIVVAVLGASPVYVVVGAIAAGLLLYGRREGA